ncbi:MAG: hypothetical protein ACD_73C00551G0005 [uncultured bacterium]|nr:MAG: hypothetical protein ACD_73C00551G0005 [uncultured bacterium]
MKINLFGLISFVILGSLTFCTGNTPHAKAKLINANGVSVGEAVFLQTKEGVKISVQVSGLTPGKHGIHFHEVGQCEKPDFKSSGGHFNPAHKKHGLQNPEGAHGGDLPNLEVNLDGTAKTTFVAKNVSLQEGENSLFHVGGTSLIIHAGEDDEKTDPSGSSGARLVCGEIVK